MDRCVTRLLAMARDRSVRTQASLPETVWLAKMSVSLMGSRFWLIRPLRMCCLERLHIEPQVRNPRSANIVAFLDFGRIR